MKKVAPKTNKLTSLKGTAHAKIQNVFTKYPWLKVGLPAIIVSIVFLVFVLNFVGSSNSNSQDEVSADTTEFTEIPVSDRPFIALNPRADGHALILTVTNHENFKNLSFELLYQAGTLQQGSLGQIDPSKTVYKQELTLGACSKGVCRYDDNVQTGSIKLTGVKNGKTYESKIPFTLGKITPEASSLTGPEGTLSINLPAASITSDYYVLIMHTLGFPQSLASTYTVEPVAAFSIAPKLNNKAKVTLQTSASGSKVSRFDISDNKWVDLQTTVATDNSFQTPNLGIFAVTK